MARDIFKDRLNNQQLIEKYEEIGEKLLKNKDYVLTLYEFCVMSAMSSRVLVHRSKFKYGLPNMNNEDKYGKL